MTAAPADAERRAGYAAWDGARTARGWRWWVIARGNLSLAWSNPWVKGLLALSLVPGIILTGITSFFLPLSLEAIRDVVVWNILFAFIVGAVIGARLVSEDRRQGAFLAHFSRPVTRFDYVAGKFVALVIPLLFVTGASGLLAIGVDTAVPGDSLVERATRAEGLSPEQLARENPYLNPADPWEAARGVIAWSVLASAITAGIVLGISALTDRARTAGIAWVAAVALLHAASGILETVTRETWPAAITWWGNLSALATWTLGLDVAHVDPSPDVRLLVLAVAGVAGLVIVDQRLRRAEGGTR